MKDVKDGNLRFSSLEAREKGIILNTHEVSPCSEPNVE